MHAHPLAVSARRARVDPARYTCRGGTHVQPRACNTQNVRPAGQMHGPAHGSSKQFPRLCGVLFLCALHRMHQSDKQVRIGRRWACMQKGNTYLHAWCLQLHCNYNRPCVVTGGHAQARRTTTRPVSRTTPYARWSAGAVSLPPLHTTRWTGRVLARWSAVSQC